MTDKKLTPRPDEVSEEELHELRIGAPYWDNDYTRLVDSYRFLRDRNAKLEAVAEAAWPVLREQTDFVLLESYWNLNRHEQALFDALRAARLLPDYLLEDAAGYSPTEGGGV